MLDPPIQDEEKTQEQLIAEIRILRKQLHEREKADFFTQKETLYNRLVQSLPDIAIYVFDHDLCYQVADGGGLEQRGLTKQSVEGRTLYEIFPPKTVEKWEPLYRAALEGKSHTLEYNRNNRSYLTRVIPIRDALGNIPIGAVISQDITERRQLEQSLQMEQDLIEKFIQTAQVIIVFVDVFGKIIRINPYLEKLSGYRSEETLGRDWFELFIPERDQERVREQFAETLRDIPVRGKINPIITKRGKERLIEWYNNTFKDSEGTIIGLLSMGIDVTRRQEAEGQLKISQQDLRDRDEKLRIAREAGGIGFWTWIHDVLIWDDQTRLLHGCQVAPTTFDEFLDGLYPKDRDRVVSAVQKSLFTGVYEDLEYRVVFPDGTVRWVLSRGKVIRDKEGHLQGVMGALLDVTERKQVEEELQRHRDNLEDLVKRRTIALEASQARFSGILDMAGDAIVSVNDDFHITLFNKGAEEIFGYKAKDAISQPLDMLIPQRFRFIHQEHMKQYASSYVRARKMSDSREITCLHRNGAEFIADASISQFSFNGERIYTVVLRDVTERRRAEDELRHSRFQIQKSLEEKEVLLKEIHHRVKNNLAIISAFLGLQSDTILDKGMLYLFQQAKDRIHTMALIHEKLYQSKDLASVQGKDFLESLSNHILASYSTASQPVELTLDVDDIWFKIDEAIPCGLIVNEIMTNALKYAFSPGEQGQIHVSLKHLNDGHHQLTLRDNGKGLPEAINLRTSKSLGLKLIQGLAGQLGGKVELFRQPGTTFQITFPTSELRKGIG